MVSILRRSKSHYSTDHSYDSSDSNTSITRNRSVDRRRTSPPADVPKGCLPVYVGEEGRRFVIPISYLTHPLLLELLKMSEEEYGFSDGAMHLPCKVLVFYRVLERIESEQLLQKVKFPRGPIGLTVLM